MYLCASWQRERSGEHDVQFSERASVALRFTRQINKQSNNLLAMLSYLLILLVRLDVVLLSVFLCLRGENEC